MKQSAFKNFSLFKTRTRYPCKQCHCTYKVVGDTWLETKKPVRATDGKLAFRIFWLCHSGHRHFRGYSKPVDWGKNLGGNQTYDDGKSFDEENQEIEREFEEMEDYAKRKSGGGSGKLFY